MTRKEKEIIRSFAHELTMIQNSTDVEKLHTSVVSAAYILWKLGDGDIKSAESSLKIW